MDYKQKPRWTYVQTEYLKTNCDKITDEEIAETLGKTLKSVRRKRQRLGMEKVEGRGHCQLMRNKRSKDVYLPEKMPSDVENEAINQVDITLKLPK